jgi:hypothetical protein
VILIYVPKATDIEVGLQQDHAFELLTELKGTIHEFNHIAMEKRQNPSSQGIATCSHQVMSEICSHMVDLKEQYNCCYNILKVRGPQATEGFQVLEQDQLWGKNLFTPHTTSDSSKQNPWFWFVGRPEGISSSDWSIEHKPFSLLHCVSTELKA